MEEIEFWKVCEEKNAHFVQIICFDKIKKEFETKFKKGYDCTLEHIFSCTKSFTGLVYVNELLTQIDVPCDVKLKDLNLLSKVHKEHHDAKMVDLINHTSGMVSGSTIKTSVGEPNKSTFGGADAIDFLMNASSYDVMCQNIYKFEKKIPEVFDYNNYGSQYFGALFEDWKRDKLDEEKYNWTIIKGAEQMGLFDGIISGESYSWRQDEDIFYHSFAFAGLEMTGNAMAITAQNILRKYLHILEFVHGSKSVLTLQGYKTNKHVVDANDTQATPGDKSNQVENVKYKYSLGFWIPQGIGSRRIVTMIGMLGQYIAFDLDTFTIVIRQCKFKVGEITNSHREFLWTAFEFVDKMEFEEKKIKYSIG
jgi:CubicO group peptidase (beta-lactamase class C family)